MGYYDELLKITPSPESGRYDPPEEGYSSGYSPPPPPEQPGWGMRALEGVGSVLGAPKRAIDWLARTGAEELYGLKQPEGATTGSIARAAFGLSPGADYRNEGYAGKLGGKAIEFATDIGTDPVTWAMGGLGKAVGEGAQATKILAGAGEEMIPAIAEHLQAAARAGRIAAPIQKGASAAFTGLMGVGAVQEGNKAIDEITHEGFTPQAAEDLLGTGLSAGGAFMGAKHLYGEHAASRATPKPEVDPRAIQETTEAIQEESQAPQVWEGEVPQGFEPQGDVRTPQEVQLDQLNLRLAEQAARAEAERAANGPAPGVGTPGAIPWETKTVLQEPAVVEQPQPSEPKFSVASAPEPTLEEIIAGVEAKEKPAPAPEWTMEDRVRHQQIARTLPDHAHKDEVTRLLNDKSLSPEDLAAVTAEVERISNGRLYLPNYEDIPPPADLKSQPPDVTLPLKNGKPRPRQWTRLIKREGQQPVIKMFFEDKAGGLRNGGGVLQDAAGEAHQWAHALSIGEHDYPTTMGPVRKMVEDLGWKEPAEHTKSKAYKESEAARKARNGDRSQIGVDNQREDPTLSGESGTVAEVVNEAEGRSGAVPESSPTQRALGDVVLGGRPAQGELARSGQSVPPEGGREPAAAGALAGIPRHRQGAVGALIDKYESINNAGRTPSMAAFEQALRDNELTDAQIAEVKAEVARRVGPEVPPVVEAAPAAEPSIRSKVKALGKPPAPASKPTEAAAPGAPEPALTPRDPALVAPGVPEGSQAPKLPIHEAPMPKGLKEAEDKYIKGGSPEPRLWPVTRIPPEEYAKADANPHYTPREEVVAHIRSPHESLVAAKLEKLIKEGKLEKGDSYTEPGKQPFIDIEARKVSDKQLPAPSSEPSEPKFSVKPVEPSPKKAEAESYWDRIAKNYGAEATPEKIATRLRSLAANTEGGKAFEDAVEQVIAERAPELSRLGPAKRAGQDFLDSPAFQRWKTEGRAPGYAEWYKERFPDKPFKPPSGKLEDQFDAEMGALRDAGVKMAAGNPGTPAPPDRAVVRQKLEALFKGQKVEDAPGEAHPNQPFIVRTPSGARIVVEPTGEIRFNEVSAEAHGPAVKAAMEQGAARAVGSMQSLGKDAWVKIVDAGELPHEIGGHVFLDHFASDRERAFVEKEWQKRSEQEGKGRSFDEVFADDFNKWWTDRQSAPSTVLGKVFERIHSFFLKTAKALGFETRGGLFREIESGKPFMREGVKPIPPGAKPGQALSAQVKTESPEFKRWFKDSKIVDERGKPKQVFHRGDFDENHNPIPEINGEGFHFGTKEAADQRPLGKMVDDNIRSLSYDKDENGNWHWDRSSDGLSSYDMGIEEGFGSKAEAQRHAERIASEEGDSSYGDDGEMPALTQAYISLKNPKRVADQAGDWTEAIRQAKAEGHDGLIYKNQFEDKGSTSYVVFKPEQIKSVNNRGTFDPNSPNVKFSTQPETNLPLLDRIKERIAKKRAEVDRDYGPGKVGDYALLRSALADETGRMAGAAVPPDQMGQYAAALGIEKPVRGQAAPKFSAQPVPAPGAPPEPPEAPKTKVTGFPKGSEEAGKLEPESVGRPRVEAKVEALRKAEMAAGLAPKELLRDTVERHKSLDPAVQQILRTQSNEVLLGKAANGKLNAQEVMAVDAVIRDLHSRSATLAEAVNKARTLETDSGPANFLALENALNIVNFEAAYARHKGIQGATQIARSLAAHGRVMEGGHSIPDQFLRKVFKDIPGISDKVAGELMTIFQTKPHQLAGAIQAALEPKKWEMFLEAWKNGLVSGMGTLFGANPVGNIGEQAARLGETATASFVDKLYSGEKQRTLGEAGAELRGGLRRLPQALGALGKDIKDILTLAPEKIDLKKGALEHQVGKIPGKLGRFVRIPYRLLGAFDDMFQATGGDSELGKLAYRKAAQELKGKSATEIKARAEEIWKEALNFEPQHHEMLAAMDKSKLERVFQGAPDKFLKGLEHLRADNPWLHIPFPFMATPGNIFKITMERSPYGFIKAAQAHKAWKAAVKMGPGAGVSEAQHAATVARLRGVAVDAMARPLMGTAILGSFMALAKGGFMTGAGPADPKKRNLLRQTGWQPYSFHIGDKYIPFNRFEPVSTLLGVSADAEEISKEEGGSDKVAKALGSLLANITNKTYLSGLSDAVSLFKDPIGTGGQYVEGLAGSLVPNIVARSAQALDPVIRDTTPTSPGEGYVGAAKRFGEGIGKTVASRLPGLSSTLPAKEGATGEEARRAEGSLGPVGEGVERFLSPVQVSTEKPEADLERKLVELGVVPSQPARSLVVPNSGGKKIPLLPEEYDVLQEGVRMASVRARRLISSPSFQRLDVDEQKRQLRLLYDRGRDTMKERLLTDRSFRARMREFKEAQP